MSDWVGDLYTENAGWELLRELVAASPRMAGSDGEAAGARIVRDAFGDLGADEVRLDDFEITGWERGSSRIHGPDGQPYECLALPRSPAGAVTGRLVDVGYGRPADFETAHLEGAIVMAASNVPPDHDRFIHRREKYYHAVEAGAAGFLFRNHIEGALAPTGSIGREDAPIGEIPAVGVSREVGLELSRLHADEPVTVEVTATTGTATSQNVHAELGPDTDRAVLVTSHVDAHDIADGAMDNGAGTAVLLEIMRALRAREDELDTRVHFIAFGAEEVGLDGSRYHARNCDLEAIKAVVNNDGTGRARDLDVVTHGFSAIRDAVEGAARTFDAPVRTRNRLNPYSDHWPFVASGVPGCQTMSVTGSRDRGWGHTAADTLDKVDSRDLRHHAILLTEAIVSLAAEETELAPRTVSELTEQLEDERKAAGMRLMGDWPPVSAQ